MGRLLDGTEQGGPIATTMQLGHTAFSIAGIAAPKPEEYPDRNFNLFTQIYRDSTRIDVRIAAAAG